MATRRPPATKRKPVSTPAVAVVESVEPPRPLGATGRKLWDEVHSRGAVRGSIEPLLMTCERLDERQRLRGRIEQVDPTTNKPTPTAQNPADRAGLRALDQQIREDFELLGLRTIVPVGAVVVADSWVTALSVVEG